MDEIKNDRGYDSKIPNEGHETVCFGCLHHKSDLARGYYKVFIVLTPMGLQGLDKLQFWLDMRAH
jgi:hypothetical protein